MAQFKDLKMEKGGCLRHGAEGLRMTQLEDLKRRKSLLVAPWRRGSAHGAIQGFKKVKSLDLLRRGAEGLRMAQDRNCQIASWRRDLRHLRMAQLRDLYKKNRV
ncbi:hypothetical protein L195_g042277 [Trifolium pratense]|uniref:Uncharacterized protein n=1 Tax=Trifolium pratense TaxID=57577 RepID=A0A2K3M601_TRIPR|nr:hypothetical protein L195_g042277 [Trifolium pratense]